VLAECEGRKEDGESWRGFLRHLQERGLKKIRLIISDKSKGLIRVLPEFYPEAAWQRWVFHFHQNILHEVPSRSKKKVAAMLRPIQAMESAAASREQAVRIAGELRTMKLPKAANLLEEGVNESLSYHDFPAENHRSLRTNNMLERINREIRRRTRVVGAFPMDTVL
jgi:transposase-like protein